MSGTGAWKHAYLELHSDKTATVFGPVLMGLGKEVLNTPGMFTVQSLTKVVCPKLDEARPDNISNNCYAVRQRTPQCTHVVRQPMTAPHVKGRSQTLSVTSAMGGDFCSNSISRLG